MKRLILYLTLLGQVVHSQPTYFNIQFDYDSIGNASTGIVETDNHYLAIGEYDSPSHFDTGFIIQITKTGFVSNFRSIDFYPGSSLRDILVNPVNPNEFDVYGIHHLGEDDIKNVDLFACRLDANSLDTIRIKSFGVPDFGDYSSLPMFRTKDRGIVITGYQFKPDNKGKLLLLRTDSLFNLIFLKTYFINLADNHFGSGMAETSDKGLLVVGTRSYNQYDRQGSFLRVDSLGNLLWWKDIVPQGDEELVLFSNIIQLADGTYLVIGRKQIFTPGTSRYQLHLLYGMNEDGDILWEKVHGDSTIRNVWWRSIVPFPDGNFLVSGYERTNGFPPDQRQYGTLAKLSAQGDVLWERRYTVSTENKLFDIFYKAIPTSDGGIIAAGSTWGDSITRENSWIVKLDSLGCMEPGCDTLTDVIELPLGENSPLEIYPNPTGGQVAVETQSGKRIKSLKVYDLQGRIILSHSYLNQGESSLRFDLSGEPPGMYFLSALVGEGWVTRQVLLH